MALRWIIHNGLFHDPQGCPLVPSGEGSTGTDTRGSAACLCVEVLNLETEDPRERGQEEAFIKLEGELRESRVHSSTYFQSLVAFHLEPSDNKDRPYLLEQAKEQAKKTVDVERIKRQAILDARDGARLPQITAIHQALDGGIKGLMFSAKVRGYGGFNDMGEDTTRAWIAQWAKTGDGRAIREEILSSREAWSSGKDQSRFKPDGLSGRGLWAQGLDLVEHAMRQAMTHLDQDSYSVVLLKDWSRFAGKMGSQTMWDLIVANDFVIRDDIMAVYVPAWAAQVLDQEHEPVHWGGTEETHLVILDDAPDNWKAATETMLVLWKEAGGTLRFRINAYGTRVEPEGNASYHNAWQSAKALETEES